MQGDGSTSASEGHEMMEECMIVYPLPGVVRNEPVARMSCRLEHQLECQGHIWLLCCWPWCHSVALVLVKQHDLHYDYYGSGFFGVNAIEILASLLGELVVGGLLRSITQTQAYSIGSWGFGLGSMDDSFMFFSVGISTPCSQGVSV